MKIDVVNCKPVDFENWLHEVVGSGLTIILDADGYYKAHLTEPIRCSTSGTMYSRISAEGFRSNTVKGAVYNCIKAILAYSYFKSNKDPRTGAPVHRIPGTFDISPETYEKIQKAVEEACSTQSGVSRQSLASSGESSE